MRKRGTCWGLLIVSLNCRASLLWVLRCCVLALFFGCATSCRPHLWSTSVLSLETAKVLGSDPEAFAVSKWLGQAPNSSRFRRRVCIGRGCPASLKVKKKTKRGLISRMGMSTVRMWACRRIINQPRRQSSPSALGRRRKQRAARPRILQVDPVGNLRALRIGRGRARKGAASRCENSDRKAPRGRGENRGPRGGAHAPNSETRQSPCGKTGSRQYTAPQGHCKTSR